MEEIEIKNILLKNIEKFDIIEFCPNGGWPNFKKLRVIINKAEQNGDTYILNITLLYQCDIPGGCFAGNDLLEQIRKTVKIHKNELVDISPTN
ncbi:hypothetical protein R9C00_23570 [Flammeovirgaceae bacterium SG7u.111]|nr:hypothetical protein [Flammeovirgaceae bacterium SG7u.132]WPO34685.1 hypothetical protein R9C00_23570 [Flammeovirgaceae bacterium SG7u.111]